MLIGESQAAMDCVLDRIGDPYDSKDWGGSSGFADRVADRIIMPPARRKPRSFVTQDRFELTTLALSEAAHRAWIGNSPLPLVVRTLGLEGWRCGITLPSKRRRKESCPLPAVSRSCSLRHMHPRDCGYGLRSHGQCQEPDIGIDSMMIRADPTSASWLGEVASALSETSQDW
jgi:hypothetical protein